MTEMLFVKIYIIYLTEMEKKEIRPNPSENNFIVDLIIYISVQWPELAENYKGTTYIGRML